MTLTEIEYAALRKTIGTRGTVRVALLVPVLAGWASLAAVVLTLDDVPITAVFSLAILVAGFEAIHALHVGVERIGRYLQVYYEAAADGPRWETTAMAVGPALPGGGIDPLFTIVFVSATMANLVTAMVPQPTYLEMTIIATLHAAFIVRLVRARGAAARQRAVELESFRAIKSSVSNARPPAPEM